MGVPFLQRTLSLQLTEHILKCLPDLKKELQARNRELSKDVAEYRASSMFQSSSSTDTKALVGYGNSSMCQSIVNIAVFLVAVSLMNCAKISIRHCKATI